MKKFLPYLIALVVIFSYFWIVNEKTRQDLIEDFSGDLSSTAQSVEEYIETGSQVSKSRISLYAYGAWKTLLKTNEDEFAHKYLDNFHFLSDTVLVIDDLEKEHFEQLLEILNSIQEDYDNPKALVKFDEWVTEIDFVY